MNDNPSGITPVGLSVLILPDSVEEKTDSGIIVGTVTELEREQLRQTDGIVMALGPMAYEDEDVPRCKVGDRVIMKAYAGMIRKGTDGIKYRLIADSDVIGILES